MKVLTGDRNAATITAVEPVKLLAIAKSALDSSAQDNSEILTGLSECIIQRHRRNRLLATLPAIFGDLNTTSLSQIVAEAEYLDLARAQPVLSRGDPVDHLYLILSGRLQSIAENRKSVGQPSEY